jgi:hypothetical protein
MGWKDLENGALIEEAEKAAFSVLITLDQNLPHQQDLASCQVGIVILAARSAELSNLIELMPQLEDVLPEAAKGRHCDSAWHASSDLVTAQSGRPFASVDVRVCKRRGWPVLPVDVRI